MRRIVRGPRFVLMRTARQRGLPAPARTCASMPGPPRMQYGAADLVVPREPGMPGVVREQWMRYSKSIRRRSIRLALVPMLVATGLTIGTDAHALDPTAADILARFTPPSGQLDPVLQALSAGTITTEVP